MSLRWKSFLAAIVAVSGAGGITVTVTQFEPDSVTIGLLLGLLFVAFGAAAIPVSALLNNRFARPDWHTADSYRLWRHAIETGIFAVILVFLQLRQTLNWVITLLFLTAFVIVETFFVTRTHNQV